MSEERLRRGLAHADVVFNWHDPAVRALIPAQVAEIPKRAVGE